MVVAPRFIVSNSLLLDGAWAAWIVSWGTVLLAGHLAQPAPGYAFKRSFIVIPFTLAAITVIFTLPGET